jgi:DNA-binding MarR family transcriptional regulator
VDAPWLDDAEMQLWRSLVRLGTLFERLDADLRCDTDLDMDAYEVLAVLSERPDGRARMSELADAVRFTRSRLTHHVDRLEARELVERERCEDDRRGTWAVLTARGLAALSSAAPCHVRSVRRHVFDLLDDAEVAVSGAALARIVDAAEGGAVS